MWEQFRAEQVYRADSLGVTRSGAKWLTMLSIGWVLARWRRVRPRSLLDNAPLAALLEAAVPLKRLPALLRARHLQALANLTSSYTSRRARDLLPGGVAGRAVDALAALRGRGRSRPRSTSARNAC